VTPFAVIGSPLYAEKKERKLQKEKKGSKKTKKDTVS
jgi:hypothetical protein